MVSASKLKNDFIKYEKDELEKLSNAELSMYRDSLVIELMKIFKDGKIIDNPDSDEINDLINNYMTIANKRFSNAETVLLDRKFRYLLKSYYTAHVNSINKVFDLTVTNFSNLVGSLIYCKLILDDQLLMYYDHYSNHILLNDLFFKLSTDDNLDVTFPIHEKYLNNEFGVKGSLMMDLDNSIGFNVKRILNLIDRIENLVNIDELSADNYFDDMTDSVKDVLKHSLSFLDDFEKTALINSGYDTAVLHQVKIAEIETNIVGFYLDVKESFMKLYNDNGFAEISADNFERLNKKYPDRYDDFDEYMKKEPKYNLKKCEFIKPGIDMIAY